MDRGILVVGRKQYGGVRIRRPGSGLSDQDVIRRYRGIDGEFWPGDPGSSGVVVTTGGLSALEQLDRVRAYADALDREEKADVLVVGLGFHRGGPQRDHAIAGLALERLGYDLGFIHSEAGTYSVLMHEIIYPRFPELVEFGAQLNAYLLLEHEHSATQALAEIERLQRKGREFEDTEPVGRFVAIEVFETRLR